MKGDHRRFEETYFAAFPVRLLLPYHAAGALFCLVKLDLILYTSWTIRVMSVNHMSASVVRR